MIDFLNAKSIVTPRGEVAKIVSANGSIIWEKPSTDFRDLYQRVEYIQDEYH